MQVVQKSPKNVVFPLILFMLGWCVGTQVWIDPNGKCAVDGDAPMVLNLSAKNAAEIDFTD